MVQRIPLTNGMFALVDDEDYEWLSAFRWYATKGRKGAVYASRMRVKDGKSGSRQMQRDILAPDGMAPRSMLADHINRDTLDNRRCNLRWVDFCTSNRNRSMMKINTSGYRGVFLSHGRYRAQIRSDGLRINSRHFDTREEAALAYNELALRYHGADAQLNVIPPEEQRL